MATTKRSKKDAERLEKLLGFCDALPEVDVSGEQHLAFRIRKKTFAYYLNDHHGDGIVSICCKSTFEDQIQFVTQDPEQYYVPAYVGAKGWVALRLDLAKVDWDAVMKLLFQAYRFQAPRRLAEEIE